MKKLKLFPALAIGTVAAFALASCSTGGGAANVSGDDGSGDDQLRVVATTTQLTDFASQVGGDDIELTGLLAAGGSAHHFDPTPADLLVLGGADVLIVNGAGLDDFMESAIEASGFSGTIIDASEGIDLEEAREITLEVQGDDDNHDHDEHEDEDHDHTEHTDDDHTDGDDHTDDDHTDESHEHEHADEDHAEHEGEHADHDHDHSHDHHDHDHGDLNPHIWTAPRLAQGMVAEIAEGFAEADSTHAAAYEERAEAYNAKLDTLDEWIDDQFDRVPEADRVLVTGHDSLRYYLHDYDIEFAGSLLPSFEDNAEPSAAEVDALIAAIKEHGVKAIFVESSLSPKLAQTVAEEAGAQVVDEQSLYADSLGAAGSGADTYIDATVHNTRVILEAWGVTPEDLPEL